MPTAEARCDRRTEHSPRALVEKLDFVTAAGNLQTLVTPIAVFQRRDGRLRWRRGTRKSRSTRSCAAPASSSTRAARSRTPPITAPEKAALDGLDPDGSFAAEVALRKTMRFFGSIPELLSSQAQDGALAQRTALESARRLVVPRARRAGAPRRRRVAHTRAAARRPSRPAGRAPSGCCRRPVRRDGGRRRGLSLEPRLAASDLALRLKSVGIEWVLADAAQAAKARELALPHTVELDEALSAASTTVPDLRPTTTR